MFYKVLITLLILDHILPLPLDKYNIIIIPIPKFSHITNYIKIPTKKSSHYTDLSDDDRIDIEHYEEPTEMPNVDDFDYLSDKNDVLRAREGSRGYSLDNKDIIRYLVARSGSGSKNKHNTDSNEAGAEKAEEYPSYDFDSIYGDNKIVGGEEVDINLYPYHVAYGSNCGAAIIDKKWALTAGHCGKKPYIRVGSKYVNQGKKVTVKHNYIHPEWASKSKKHPFDFDFQLLELAEPLKFGDNIQPVKVAHIEDMVIGKVITVTGWGNTKENGPYSNILRAVRVPIISKENCQHVPFPYFRGGLTSRMFCAGFSAGMKDACQGDSGGPAMANDRLLGMVSFGYGCATPGAYGVYSKVAKVRSWIEEVTGLNLD